MLQNRHLFYNVIRTNFFWEVFNHCDKFVINKQYLVKWIHSLGECITGWMLLVIRNFRPYQSVFFNDFSLFSKIFIWEICKLHRDKLLQGEHTTSQWGNKRSQSLWHPFCNCHCLVASPKLSTFLLTTSSTFAIF